MADHHLGRGFAVGGPNFPKSTQSKASRPQMLAAISAQIEFWEREFDEHQPELVLDGNQFNQVVANKRGIPIRCLAASRHRNFHYWAHSNFYETPAFESTYTKLQSDGAAVSGSEIQHAYAVVQYWQTAMETTKLRGARAGEYEIARRTYDIVKGREPKSYYLLEELMFLWRMRRQEHVVPGDRDSPINKDFYANLKAQGWRQARWRFENTHRAVTEQLRLSADGLISFRLICKCCGSWKGAEPTDG